MARRPMRTARRPWRNPVEPMKKAEIRDTPEQARLCLACPFPDDCKAGWQNKCPVVKPDKTIKKKGNT